MNALKAGLALVLALGFSFALQAAEVVKGNGGGEKPMRGDKEGKGEKGERRADKERDGMLVGMLSEKPADSKGEVVAVLKTKRGDSYNLLAAGQLAAQISDLAKKGAAVRVMGDETPEGVKVLKIGEAGPGRKEGDNPKEGKGEGKGDAEGGGKKMRKGGLVK